jgi:flavin-dependent dehydrogenase
MYDAIIVGARCAGAPTAMLLARQGFRILLCDRAAFPSDTVSNGMFNSPGLPYLQRWGLLDELKRTGVPPVQFGTTFVFGQRIRTEYAEPTFAPRRIILDHMLVQAAVKAGAELRERLRVTGLVYDDEGRVAGIRALTSGNKEVVEHARLVVGADGRRSMMARLCRAQEYARMNAPVAGGVLTYYSNVPTEGYEFWIGGQAGMAILAPSGNDLTHVSTFGSAIGTPVEQFDRVVSLLPELRERLQSGTRAAKLVAYRESPVVLRKAHGPGWALVGDATFHQGPFGGFGMAHAFRDADALASAVSDWLNGDIGYDDAMSRYGNTHDEWSRAFYDWEAETMRAYAEGRQPPSVDPLVAKWHAEIRS